MAHSKQTVCLKLLLGLIIAGVLIAANEPPPTGNLKIVLIPVGRVADIYVDEVLVATQVRSFELTVAAGQHRVSARNVSQGFANTYATTVFAGWTRNLTVDVSAPPDPQALYSSYSWRFGVGVPNTVAEAEWVARTGAGWWYDWRMRPNLGGSRGEYWQMIRLWNCVLNPAVEVFVAEAKRRPGQTWIISNEPDVVEQDNVTPECLADLYHQAYTALKAADPRAKVAMGGVVQASPLRLKYLDRTLSYYQTTYGAPLPVDIWTMHAYILREEIGNWGAGVPTGFTETTGWLIEPGDHGDLDRFKSQLVDFRTWLADHGYADKPLVITEYGILLPADYGFTADRVQAYMLGSFDILLQTTDPELGLAADGYHLVQRWAWFSMSYDLFPTSNLYAPESKTLTPLGQAFRNYVSGLR
jgi:hypothetical protein